MTDPRVLIVEDEVIVAESLRRNLEACGYEVIGHAVDGQEAIQLAHELRPDVILMDIVLGGCTNGIEAARLIQRAIDTSIIYVTGQSDHAFVNDAARSGAAGYIVKPFQAQQVTASITIALHRRTGVRSWPMPPAEEDVRSPLGGATAPAIIHGLDVTPREKEVIRGLLHHRRLGKVAAVLGISVHTARNHLKSIFRKLNLHSQDELIELLVEQPSRPSLR